MLKNIDPLLNADLLHVLAAMGHGDDIAGRPKFSGGVDCAAADLSRWRRCCFGRARSPFRVS
jgi:hypothetical protein